MSARLIYGVDVITGLKQLETESVNCVVTSPPYWGLRDYGTNGQIGLEKTPDEFVLKMVDVFREVKRVLRKDGTCWVNLGDTYNAMTGTGFPGTGQVNLNNKNVKQIINKSKDRSTSRWGGGQVGVIGLKPKNLIGVPWRVAFALQADDWYLRQDIIWAKPNPMPESVTDRCTKSHEYIFLLSKSSKYFFDAEAIKEDTETFDESVRDRDTTKLNNIPGRSKMNGLKTNGYEKRNKRSVWEIPTQPYPEAHFATFPMEIPKICIMAGCPMGGVVLDPFSGSGTKGEVATGCGREYIGIDLNKEYEQLAKNRIGLFVEANQ